MARKGLAPAPALDYQEACRLLSVDFTTLADEPDPADDDEDRHPDPLAGRTGEAYFDRADDEDAI